MREKVCVIWGGNPVFCTCTYSSAVPANKDNSDEKINSGYHTRSLFNGCASHICAAGQGHVRLRGTGSGHERAGEDQQRACAVGAILASGQGGWVHLCFRA